MARQTKSVEPEIADLCNRWMHDMGLDYKLEQGSLNEEIDKALAEYESKMGWSGAGIVQMQNCYLPIAQASTGLS